MTAILWNLIPRSIASETRLFARALISSAGSAASTILIPSSALILVFSLVSPGTFCFMPALEAVSMMLAIVFLLSHHLSVMSSLL